MAKIMLQCALKAIFMPAFPTFSNFAARMNNFLAGLASADIDPTPHIETILSLGRRLIRIEVLDEEREKRLNPREKEALQDLRANLETAKKKLAEIEEASRPFHAERESCLAGITLMEDTIKKMEAALAEARENLATYKQNLPRLDDLLVKVEQDALAQANEVQGLETSYVKGRLLVDRHASETVLIDHVLSLDVKAALEEANSLM